MNSVKLYILLPLILLLGFGPLLGANIDNVLNAFFYTENNSSYLILHESIYHPTVGSYEKGNMRTEGYNSSRISVYNIDNGSLIAQKNMGVMDSTEACFLLGCSNNNLWIYCNKFKSGLQSFYPLTLERNISQAKIYKLLNISIGRFAEPKWQVINEYYGFDAIQQKLIVTNTAGKQYYIDTKTFATQPIVNKINLANKLNNYLAESVELNDSVWKLSGYDEMKLKCGTHVVATPTFLYGKFVLEQNRVRLFKYFFNLQEGLISEKEKFEKLGNTILVNKVKGDIQKSKNNIEALISGKTTDNVLLQANSNSLFVLSKSESVNQGVIEISKLSSARFGVFDEEWSTPIGGMFYNVSRARNTKEFKSFFGDFDPTFNYRFIQMHNNKLIIIYLLQVCCIDVNSGSILWQFKLR